MSLLKTPTTILEEFSTDLVTVKAPEYLPEHPALASMEKIRLEKTVDHLNQSFIEVDPYENKNESN